MEEKKALVIYGIGVILGIVLAAMTSNILLLLLGWILIGYCGVGLYFSYKGQQKY